MQANAFIVLSLCYSVKLTEAQCSRGTSMTFARWSGVSSDRVAPVFVYTASGDEESLVGACLSRCRELGDCAAVIVAYGKGNCMGVAATPETHLKLDNDVAYFKKICLDLPDECTVRWWAIEGTPGYHLLTDSPLKVLSNRTINECYVAISSFKVDRIYRSAQWIGQDGSFDPEMIKASDSTIGACVLNAEDKFTEPESYRVSNYYTFYIENQCRHDYSKKIDRCSYEEYYNQTLKHVEYTVKNYTKDECKEACEMEERFICRGFTWISGGDVGGRARGICDLHSEDLVTTGSWLLRRISAATYYRRVICLNISVDCEDSNVIVTYRPRGVFRGRMYVPGRGEQCSARSAGGPVKLTLPMHGDCDVNFAYGISNGPNGVINRTMAYVMVMIQNNPIIQTAGDRWVRVGCSPGTRSPAHVDAMIAVRDNARATMTSESGSVTMPAEASAIYGTSAAPLTLYVVRVDEEPGRATGGVSLGELLELCVETTDPTEVEVYHLVASSRLGDSSVLLIDGKGCPTGQVDFPAFTRSWLGGTQRLSARFKAFRFPTSHVVRFSLMARYCENKCKKVNCSSKNQGRTARETNGTSSFIYGNALTPPGTWGDDARGNGVVAQGRARGCGADDGEGIPLELEMTVDSKDILSADTLIRADHRSNLPEDARSEDTTMVCMHELLLVALALAWLAVQVLLLIGCCVLVKRYRNLAELSMQKDYHSFDNVGFDTVSTHRRVHWPDQQIDILHAT